jgi:hypothetical protein
MRAACILAFGCWLAAAPSDNDPARAMLDKAMRAAGGEANLARYKAFRWTGKATVHAGGRDIPITGEWQVQPPDKAHVRNDDELGGRKNTRLLVLAGDRGWTQINGQTRPMDPALHALEREQFYLYELMRLAPLKGEPYRLAAAGAAGLRVSRASYRDVELTFDPQTWLLVKATSRRTDPGSGQEVVQEMALSGHAEAGGIRWPRRLVLRWDGRPFFDLEIAEFTPLEGLEERLFTEPK